MQQVKQGSTAPGYTYGADGNRVKAVMGSSTTGGFLPRITRITTKAEARFVQIGEIRGRENQAVFCHIEHKERKDAANLRIFCCCSVFYAFLVVERPPNSELLPPIFAS